MPEKAAHGQSRRGGLRADARRSIERIVTAAVQLTAEQGPEVTLEEIAREAGVAPATLYRHFPSRMHLFEYIYRGRTQELAARATALSSTQGPLDALIQWLREFIDLGVESDLVLSSLLGQGLKESDPDANQRWGYEQLIAAVESLLGAAQRAKVVGSGIEAGELLYLATGLVKAIELAASRGGAASPAELRERYMELMLDGLHARPVSNSLSS
jgi:AcrR family transcriptional regulator